MVCLWGLGGGGFILIWLWDLEEAEEDDEESESLEIGLLRCSFDLFKKVLGALMIDNELLLGTTPIEKDSSNMAKVLDVVATSKISQIRNKAFLILNVMFFYCFPFLVYSVC